MDSGFYAGDSSPLEFGMNEWEFLSKENAQVDQ
jgi:hypothetical protein